MVEKVNVGKFILSLLKEDKKDFIKIVAIAIFGACLNVFIPYLYGRLFDLALIPSTPTNLLLSLIAIWAALGLITNYTSTRTSALGDKLSAKLVTRAEIDAYAHYLKLPVAFHKSEKSGEITNKISRSAMHLEFFIRSASEVLPSLIFVSFALLMMLFIQWQLALIIILTILAYMLVTFKLSEPLLKAEEKARRSWEREYGNIFDKLYNVYLVKNFTMEEAEKKRFEKALFGKAFPKYEEAIKRFERLQHAQGIIYTISFVIALGAAILFLRNGQITQGEFIMFFGYVNQFYGPFFSLSKFYTDSKKVSVAVKRIVSLERIAPETIEHGNKTIKDFKGHILFKNLSFRYTKKKEVLHDINLEIKPGECVALVGESGVGKTTLAEMILGYWKPTKGNIYLDGVDVSELSLKWLREKIAFVPQEISLFNDTLINNIRYANPSATFDDVVRAAKAANAHDFIMSLPKGYNTLVGERGVKLSVGQKQRISLTMAFLKNPKILILDEPTSAQDVKSERAIQEGIKRLISGRTTIIIAHRFSTIRNADKIVVLDKGRIVEVGSHDELMKKKGKYYGFYTLQRGLD